MSKPKKSELTEWDFDIPRDNRFHDPIVKPSAPANGQPDHPDTTAEMMLEWLRGEFLRGKDKWIVEDLNRWLEAQMRARLVAPAKPDDWKQTSRAHCVLCGKSDNSHGPTGEAYDKSHTFVSCYEAYKACVAPAKAGEKRSEAEIVKEYGEAFSRGWAKYQFLFQNVPHGTAKQMAALLELVPEFKTLILARHASAVSREKEKEREDSL